MEELVNLPAESAQQEGKAAPGLSWEKWHKPDAIERTQKKVLHMMRYFHEGDFLFKIGISLVSAIAAAVVIMLSGMYADRMTEIVAMRACIGFFLSGTVVFLATLWLDDVGIPLYVSRHEELQQVWLSEAEDEDLEADVKADITEQPDVQEVPETGEPETAQDGEESAGAEEPAFAPLGDSVQHMHAPEAM